MGAKWDWSRYNAATPYLGSLTGSFTTFELVWCAVEKEPGMWRWSQVDAVVSQTMALGIQLGLKLRTGACWATRSGPESIRGAKDKTESVPPASMSAYLTFVRRAVHRYAPLGVNEWAIENEINSDQMWRGSLTDYANLATAAAREIRDVDPTAQIVDSGLSSSTVGIGLVDSLMQEGDYQAALQVYNSYFARRTTRRDELPTAPTVPALQAIMSSDTAVNALATLAATRTLFAQQVFDIRQVHFYESWENVPALLSWLRTQSPARTPLEVWEAGQFWVDSAASDQARAEEVGKTVALMLAGGVRRVVWLPLAYDPSGRHSDEPRYGLLDPNGTVRPAGAMVADLAALTRGASVMPVMSAGLQGVVVVRADVSTLVVWSIDAGAHSFDPRDLSDVTIRALGGSATTPTDVPETITTTPEVVTATATPGQLLERLR